MGKSTRQRTGQRARAAQPSRGALQATINRLTDEVRMLTNRAIAVENTQQAAPTSAVNIPVPTITIVKYADRTYLHRNGAACGRGLTPDEGRIAQWALEQAEATGAVNIAEADLRYLSLLKE